MALLLIAAHAPLLRLPYFWDEAGYYVPAARDLLSGSLIPHATPSNAHPPLVLAYLALSWKLFGQRMVVTRCAMLVCAAFSLLGFFRLARRVSNSQVAIASSLLTAIYPVFFAQSSLAQVDLAAAGIIFWGLDCYVGERHRAATFWFSLAALAKETAILAPVGLLLFEIICVFKGRRSRTDEPSQLSARVLALIVPLVPLTVWYAYHYLRTGYVFGNPEFFRYNVQSTIHPLRIFLALLLRIWQAVGYLGLYLPTLACLLAMRSSPRNGIEGERPRIRPSIQAEFFAIGALYVVVLATIGGAMLARYMLPVVPLVLLLSVSTIWRRLRFFPAMVAIVALGFLSNLFFNPPYGLSLEDNLAYRDYIVLHRRAEGFLQARYPRARVLTAWPASSELSDPSLGYVTRAISVVEIENFTLEQLLSAADQRPRFDVALVFSTKYEPRTTLFRRWRYWQEWKARYFDFHTDLPPKAAASVLGGTVAYADDRDGQWIAIIELEKMENAKCKPCAQETLPANNPLLLPDASRQRLSTLGCAKQS